MHPATIRRAAAICFAVFLPLLGLLCPWPSGPALQTKCDRHLRQLVEGLERPRVGLLDLWLRVAPSPPRCLRADVPAKQSVYYSFPEKHVSLGKVFVLIAVFEWKTLRQNLKRFRRVQRTAPTFFGTNHLKSECGFLCCSISKVILDA